MDYLKKAKEKIKGEQDGQKIDELTSLLKEKDALNDAIKEIEKRIKQLIKK